MAHGEEVVALKMYHAIPDEGVQPRCINFDDVYSANEHWDCDLCYGSGFENGIKQLGRVWAMFTTDALGESQTKQGQYQPFSHQVTTEPVPMLIENDYILRISRWSSDHRPLGVHAAYDLKVMTPESVRTGNQLGQDGNDYVALKGKATELPRTHPIYKVYGNQISEMFPVPRTDGRVR